MFALLTGIRLALLAIVRNKLRAGLTVLGILIGVAAVVTVTALGSGARASVASQIQALGSNAIIVFPQRSAASGARGAQGAGQRLTEEDGRAIQREAVSVAAVAPSLGTRAQIVYGDRNWSTVITGTRLPFFTIRSWNVVRGELWDEHDEALKAKKIVIGQTVKTMLFGTEDAIGRTVRIGRYPYTVIGVLEAKGEGPFGDDQDDVVVMPITSMRARVRRTPPGHAGSLLISATSAETTHRAVAQIDSILRQRHRIAPDRDPDFAIRTQKEFQEMQTSIYTYLTYLLVMIAGVSLVVGGIGVMNIMLVSVTERTREIGIRMAIGAREHDIRSQFLVEAVVLSSCGGLAGALVGLLAIAGLSMALGWPMALDPTALGVAMASSTLTGVVFGFFPAQRAARLDPILALRHE